MDSVYIIAFFKAVIVVANFTLPLLKVYSGT